MGIIGTKPNQVPTNGDLGKIAFRDDNPVGGIVGTTDTQTLTNKTIDASSNTISNIDLSTDITGTLAAANGGTGLTSPGTSGNVLTSNGSAWVSSAPAGGGAWEYLSTTTASGVSSVTVSGIGSTYDMYAIIGTNIRTSLTTGLLARMIIGGTERTSSFYLYSLSAGATNSNNTSSDISLTVTDIDNSSTNACSFIMYIPMPYLTTTYKSIIWDFYYPGNGFQVNGTVAYNQSGVTGALTGIVLDPSGTATLNGTFRLYGIKNS